MSKESASKSEHWRYAFLAALMTSTAAMPAYAAASASGDAAPSQEIIVTATKRSENLQKVPISIQALTPAVLSQHQIASFDDYAKLLPSVSFQSFGPGQSQPYFRGITSGADGLHSGSEPGTGIYLDETPVTTIGNGLDVHLYDVSRVEALSGPQGTLFGASSLSGTLRIITNQPDPKKFSAAFDLQGDKFGPGAAGGVAEGYVNIPITDKIAIRLVGFDEHDGGYIDNVLKTRDFTLTDGSTLAENNAKYVKKNFNYADTYGGRAALKVQIDDNWSITPSIIYQNQVAHGNFLYNPQVGDLKTSDFAPEYNRDRWYQAALTIQGKVGDWDVLYAGGYFGRHVDNATDYSYYAVAYDAMGASSYVTFPDGKGGYLDPDQQVTAIDRYTKETHEFRVNSPTNNPLRLVAGAFYERQTDAIIANYIVPGLAASGDPRSISDAGVPGAGDDIYYTNVMRIDRDFALFSELYLDLLPNLTLEGGFRYFTVDNTIQGVSGFVGATPFDKGATEYGETHKLNLSWKITPKDMVYATYSTGFRPGGVNRRESIPPYNPDTITNYELGAKTSWMDGRLRINGAVFDEEWHDVQFSLSPVGFQGVTFIYNVGYARSQGIEGDVNYHIDDHFTLSGSGTLLHAKLTKTFCDSSGSCAYSGSELPIQPKYKLNATLRYEFDFRDYKPFLQGAVQTQGNARSALLAADQAILGSTKAFTTFDASGGFSKDNWSIELFAQNLLDRRGKLSINTDCSITYCGPYPLVYPNKPQFFGIKLSMKYE